MSKSLQLKYVKLEANGRYKYYRRYPTNLVRKWGKEYFVRVLGRTEAEAIANFPAKHEEFNRLKALYERQSFHDSPRDIEEWVRIAFSENKLDIGSSGRTEDERTARDAEVDRVESKYAPYADSHPRQLMSLRDRVYVDALRGGWDSVEMPCTVNTAFDLYLKEKRKPDAYSRKKQEQRFDRVRRHLFDVIKSDQPLGAVRKRHAREVRDKLSEGRSPSSVRRMINDLKAVFNFAIQEFELDATRNPFASLELPERNSQPIDDRMPLPDDVIRNVYTELEAGSMLFDAWAIAHHTGAAPSEILGLMAKDIVFDTGDWSMVIEPNEARGLKEIVRVRTVPLVGLAEETVRSRVKGLDPSAFLFPQNATPRGHHNFSQNIMRQVRKYRTSKKQVFYSLRHNMKDSLIDAGASSRQQFAILGHTLGGSPSEGYGSRPSLGELRRVLESICFARCYPCR